MENNTMNLTEQSMDYQSLVDALLKLQEQKNSLEAFLAFQTQSFSGIEQFLKTWEVRYDFDTIVEDVNARLEEPSAVESGERLMEWLKDNKLEVENLEKALQNLEKEYGVMRQKPDRHGKVETAQKVEFFLKSLPQMHIAQIRETVDETVPRLLREIQAVLKAFELENDKQAVNMELAARLLERIEGYHEYANKFNVFNICDSYRKKVKAVMQTPDVIPEKDTAILMSVKKELDDLDAKFAKEQKEFDDLETEINDNIEKIWEEDYNAFSQVFEKKSCMVATTIDKLRNSYETLKQRKQEDIASVSAPYSGKKYTWKTYPVRCKKIMEHFNAEIDELRNSFVSRSALTELLRSIDAYIRERKREIRRKIWDGLKKYLFKPIYWIVAGIFILIITIIKFFFNKSED